MRIFAESRRSKSELNHPSSRHISDDRPFFYQEIQQHEFFSSVRFFPLFPEGSRKCTSGRNLSLGISFITLMLILLGILLPPWLKCLRRTTK